MNIKMTRVITTKLAYRLFAFLACLILSIALLTRAHSGNNSVKAASLGDVIINEIMYNPGTGNQNDEFLELYNTTGASIDLTGWSFSAGIILADNGGLFNGVSIPSHGYIIVSPNIAQTLATYGVVSSASYAGSALSNSGETVTLIDDSSNVISSVTYSDHGLWPTSPDGNGPSLELKDTNLDPSDPANWAASTANGGTPLAQNSNVGLNLPTIANVTNPTNIPASTAVNITAEVTGSGITSVQLTYKINFDSDVVVTMYDDGAHNDGAAGDNVYGAQIPGQAIKTLVRFKVSATNGSGTKTSPTNDDSINYHGYYVKDPGESSNLPIIQWFMSDADYNDMRDNHRDGTYYSTVVVYGDDVHDNTRVKIRGNDSIDEDKTSYKFKLPSGHTIQPTGASLAINNFTLLGIAKLSSMSGFVTSWWIAKQADVPVPDFVQSRLNRNGNFEGAYVYIDKYDNEWRRSNGFDNNEIYDTPWEVLSGAPDTTHIQNFLNTIGAFDRRDSGLREYALNNVDMSAEINYMAARAAMGLNDTSDTGNIINYFNSSNDRWGSLFWDLDGASLGWKPQISIYDMNGQDNLDAFPIQKSIYNNKEFRSMYLRRLRTIDDKIYLGNAVINYLNSSASSARTEMLLDLLKWPQALNWGSHDTFFVRQPVASYEQMLVDSAGKHKMYIEYFQRIKLGIPPSQTDAERQSVSINEIAPDESNHANQYIKLYNNANTAVDISNWTITGINYTIPAGAVIPSKGYIYLLRDDINYRASHSAVLVAGQYSNDLGGSGTLTLKTDSNMTVSTRSY